MPEMYNQGGTTSSVGPQITDFDMTQIAVTEAKKKKVFSQITGSRTMKKNHGKTFKRYKEYPILHEANVNDQGIDGAGQAMASGKWYAYQADGTRTEHATKEEAKAVVGQIMVKSGNGNLYGSSRDFVIQQGSLPIKREEGGNINVVGIKRSILTATVERYSMSLNYTKDALELDTDTQLSIKFAMKIGEAYGDIRETIIRNGIMTEAAVNTIYSGTATQRSEIDETCQLSYEDVRDLKRQADTARVPYQTRLFTGTTKIGTTPIPSARFVYVPIEAENALRDLTHNGKVVFQDVSEYASVGVDEQGKSKATTADGEIGRIDNFRFIVVHDMPYYDGEGSDATDGADNDADGIEDAGSTLSISNNGHYNVFQLVLVGDGAVETLSLEGENTKVRHGRPQIIAGLDNTGDNGVVSIEWWQGMLVNYPERLISIFCSCPA